jgi:hypothetical protein
LPSLYRHEPNWPTAGGPNKATLEIRAQPPARIAERIKAGLRREKAQGKRLGRPRKVRSTIVVPGGSVRGAARIWGVPKSTAARWISGTRVPATAAVIG